MSDRVHVPDPALMFRARRRMVTMLVIALLLTMFFTVGGISLLAAGELAGLPFAVGGATLQIGSTILVVSTRRIGSTFDGRTVARASLVAAGRAAGMVRRITLATLLALLVYGVVRLTMDDPGSLLTACIIGIGLFFLARGSKNLVTAQGQALSRQLPS